MSDGVEICPAGTTSELARLRRLIEDLTDGSRIILPSTRDHAVAMFTVAEHTIKLLEFK